MSKKSTAFRLNVYISLAVAVILIAMIAIYYRFSLQLIHENVEKKVSDLSSKTISEIRKNVISSESIAKNTAMHLPYFIDNGDVRKLLSHIMSDYPYVQAIHIDLEDIFPGSPVKYSIYRKEGLVEYRESNKPAFVNDLEEKISEPITSSGGKGWTEPFICEEAREAVSMYCLPFVITEQGVGEIPAGYVFVELSLSFLNEEIKHIKVGESGFSFLISKEGTYLTHPNEEWILTWNIKNLSETVYKGDRQVLTDLPGKDTSGSFIAYPSLLDYKRSWVYYTPIPENNWMLIFVVPFSELFAEISGLLFKLLIISLAGLVLIFFLIAYISKKLMDPLAQIASEIHDFSTAGRVPNSVNEVETLKKSFALIQAWYEKFKVEREENRLSKKQIKRELEQASEIINNIIPTEVPVIAGEKSLEISSAFRPANVVGGDLYDYFLIDDNHLLIAIGDVSGKGISAAIFMGVAHTLLRSNVSARNPDVLIKELNRELFSKNPNQYFLTLFVGILNIKSGVLKYCNAAHTTSLIVRAGSKVDELAGSHGLPLGIYNNKEYASSSVTLCNDDILVLYTDGITDSVNDREGRFGENKLKEIIAGSNNNTAPEIVNNVENQLKEFRNGTKQNDDYSLVVLKYKMP